MTFALATITPSGNRVVENVVQAMIRDVPGGSAHFTRIPVVGDTGGVSGYDWGRMLDAATLLSHAKPDIISWNGTKGGTLGFSVDTELCKRISDTTECPASTSALAIVDALTLLKARSLILVTPYDTAYQNKCIAAFTTKGFTVVAERHSGLLDNLSYAHVSEADIAAMTRAAAAETRADAIIYFCTNFNGAHIAPLMEQELNIPVLDSTALGVWGALRTVKRTTHDLQRWGKVFSI